MIWMPTGKPPEKPLGMDVAQCEEMVTAVKKAKVVNMVCHNYRRIPAIALAKRMIEDAGLGLAPGRAFGPEGEGWLRWCYAADSKKIESGIERMAHFLSK